MHQRGEVVVEIRERLLVPTAGAGEIGSKAIVVLPRRSE
jgi:hypothetical protein